MPKEVEHWSMTTLREKLVKIGAKVVSHGRYVTFQLADGLMGGGRGGAYGRDPGDFRALGCDRQL